MQTIKLRRDSLLEIKRTQMKGEDLYSYSEELVRDEAAEDADLRLQVGEEAPPRAEQMQQAWVVL